MGKSQKRGSYALILKTRKHVQLIYPGEIIVFGYGKYRNNHSSLNRDRHPASGYQLRRHPVLNILWRTG